MKKYLNLKGTRNNSSFSNSTIYLIRHGECMSNIGIDVSNEKKDLLTEKGKQQAINCGLFLKEYLSTNTSIKIHTSQMQRAKETGRLISDNLKCDFGFCDDRLNEISHYNNDFDVKGDLNYENIFERIDRIIKEIWINNKSNINIIITHQGVLELLICRLISNYYSGNTYPILDNREDEVYFEIHSNTGISSFRINEMGKIKGLICWNINFHLKNI